MANKCERCEGRGWFVVNGFIHYADGSSRNYAEMKCSDCDGTGSVTDAQLQAKRIGKFIKAGRQEMDMSVREQAKILGITASELCNIENGRI